MEKDSEKTRQAKRLIEEFPNWVHKKHEEVDYFLTQCLSEHGCFKTYLKRFHIIKDSMCNKCLEEDSPKHALFNGQKILEEKLKLEEKIDTRITPDNIIDTMLQNIDTWDKIKEYVA